MGIIDQVKVIQPSVKDALFRHLKDNECFNFLWKNRSIIGFEVDLERNNNLDGFVFIAINKQRLIAYKSDLGETQKLILFPTLEFLVTDMFDIKNLYVDKKMYRDDTFNGRKVSSGKLIDVARDLIGETEKVVLPNFSNINKDELEQQLNNDFYKDTKKTLEIAGDDEYKSHQTTNENTSTNSQPPVDNQKADKNTNGDESTKKTFIVEGIEDTQYLTKEDIEQLSLDKQLRILYNNDYFEDATDVADYCVLQGFKRNMVIMLLNYLLSRPEYATWKKPIAIYNYVQLLEKVYLEGKL